MGDKTRLEITKHFSMTERVKGAIPDAILGVAEQGATLAVALCPVDTGHLRQSIDAELVSDKKAIYGSNEEYAPYIEFGTGIYAEDGNGRKTTWTYYHQRLKRYVKTKGYPAQPFLRMSADMLKDKAGRIFARYLKRGVHSG